MLFSLKKKNKIKKTMNDVAQKQILQHISSKLPYATFALIVSKSWFLLLLRPFSLKGREEHDSKELEDNSFVDGVVAHLVSRQMM